MTQKRAGTLSTEHTITTIISLVGDPAAYEVTLTEKEYAGIGYITVQWAMLETAIATVTQHLCDLGKIPLPTDATNFSFARRLRVLRSVACKVLKESDVRTTLLRQLPIIARLAGQRQRITHHMWEYNPGSPLTLWTKSIRDPSLRLEPFNTQKMWGLGQSIGQVTYALLNPTNRYPTMADALREIADEEGHVSFASRSFLLRLHERAPQSQDHSPETPPERTPPQPSSKG